MEGLRQPCGSYRVIDANVSREESIDIGEVVESKETIVEAEGESHLNIENSTLDEGEESFQTLQGTSRPNNPTEGFNRQNGFEHKLSRGGPKIE